MASEESLGLSEEQSMVASAVIATMKRFGDEGVNHFDVVAGAQAAVSCISKQVADVFGEVLDKIEAVNDEDLTRIMEDLPDLLDDDDSVY